MHLHGRDLAAVQEGRVEVHLWDKTITGKAAGYTARLFLLNYLME